MSLHGKKIAFLVADEGVEQVELTKPWSAVEEAGGQPVLVVGSPQDDSPKQAQAFNHLDKADTFDTDVPLKQAKAEEYDGLVLPGGVANPDFLRMIPEATAFVKNFADAGRPIAVICHGPWTLLEAGVVKGRRMTSWPSLRTDLGNAGAEWVDEEVVVDRTGPGVLISSRNPDDLPAFTAAIGENF